LYCETVTVAVFAIVARAARVCTLLHRSTKIWNQRNLLCSCQRKQSL